MIFFFAYLQLQLPIKKKKCPHDDKNVKKRTFSHVIGKTVNWNKTTFLRGNLAVPNSTMLISFDPTSLLLEMLWTYKKVPYSNIRKQTKLTPQRSAYKV